MEEESEYEMGEELLKMGKRGQVTKIPYNQYTLWDSLNLSKSASGIPVPNIDNIARVLEGLEQYKNIVWFDTFHHKFRTKWGSSHIRDWQDVDDINLTRIMQSDVGIVKVNLDTVRQAMQSHARTNPRNEPMDWLKTIPEWDGIERTQHFFSDCFGAVENEYTHAVSANFWIGLVARICDAGCKLDTMVILEGPQGNKKSSALRIIGGEWFTESAESVRSKDFYLVLQGHILVELAELDSLGNADITKVKAMLANPVDCFRSPYARIPEKKPRQCMFVGTTNESIYLKDSSGGRRFWPIKTSEIRLDLIREHREQLFAEAHGKYKIGATWHEVPNSAKQEQEDRRQVDTWESLVAEWLVNRQETQIAEVLSDCLKIEAGKQDKPYQMRVSHCLKAAGWERKRIRRGGVLLSVWYPPDVYDLKI